MIRVEVDASRADVSNLPKEIEQRVRLAIRRSVKVGKSEARERIKARYTARSPMRLGKMRSQIGGLTGSIVFSGSRNRLPLFNIKPRTRPPHRPSGGISVQVVRGSGGRLPHAFIGKGQVFERVGRSRLPIRRVDTLSLAGMAKAVSDGVLDKMTEELKL